MTFSTLRNKRAPFLLVSGWKANLFILTLLIGLVVCYFIWQINQVTTSFQNHARDHARVLAGVVRLNIQRTQISQENGEEIMNIFLGKTAEFISYLDRLDPFSPEELTAFAQEAGLAGISVVRDGTLVEGPPDWSTGQAACPGSGATGLRHLAGSHLYYLPFRVDDSPESSCIIVGLEAARIERIRRQTGMETLLADLTALPGIDYVRLHDDRSEERLPSTLESEPRMVEHDGGLTAEVQLPLENEILVVGIDARQLEQRIDALNREFILFITLLIPAGLFLSWLLYRYQSLYLKKTREFERELGRQREEAALGRATATITHEIRNPLNAIAMGVQRLQLETLDLSAEHARLLDSMGKALGRTNHIIANLQKFSGSGDLVLQETTLAKILEPVLVMYEKQCLQHGITVSREISSDPLIRGDVDLLGQVVENLLKNAIEAQPEGGMITVRLGADNGQNVTFTMENTGFSLGEEDAGCLKEPYFTSKTSGCGLGLAISERIVEAHGGSLLIDADAATGRFAVSVVLPVWGC